MRSDCDIPVLTLASRPVSSHCRHLLLTALLTAVQSVVYVGKRESRLTIPSLPVGTPPLAQSWLVQSVIYVGIMIVEKLLVSALIQLDIWDTVSRIILAPVTNPRLELAIVVLVIPFFVNVSYSYSCEAAA